jgi:hypothetical protein
MILHLSRMDGDNNQRFAWLCETVMGTADADKPIARFFEHLANFGESHFAWHNLSISFAIQSSTGTFSIVFMILNPTFRLAGLPCSQSSLRDGRSLALIPNRVLKPTATVATSLRDGSHIETTFQIQLQSMRMCSTGSTIPICPSLPKLLSYYLHTPTPTRHSHSPLPLPTPAASSSSHPAKVLFPEIAYFG